MNKMKSMTGYGKADGEISGRKFRVEVRSINSKNLDLALRFPYDLREWESEGRGLVSRVLQRGKVECYVNFLQSEGTDNAQILRKLNRAQVELYRNGLEQMGAGTDKALEMAVALPGSVMESPAVAYTDSEKQVFLSVLEAALLEADRSRAEEGRVLAGDFAQRVALIEKLADDVEPFEKERVGSIRARLEKQLSDWEELEKKTDVNRLEQEMIYYLEKLDITEEKVRLHKHCRYFTETMQEEASGRKLAFIAQEMGREINTLGSKANEVNIQKLVVQMKDELEKIKEQLFNIL